MEREINWKDNMNEIGGAFLLSWAVFGMGNVEFAIVLAVAWMAFAGAHLLPVVTWCHMLTGDLSDTEGNWMPNGMRLLAQVIGACLALVLMTEAGGLDTEWVATDMWITEFNGDTLWTVLGLIAAGAIWWQIHTRCESVWASGIGMMALMAAGAMMVTYDGLFTPGSYRPMRYTFLIWVMVIVGGSGNNFGAILGGFAVWFLWIEAAPIALFLINFFTSGISFATS